MNEAVIVSVARTPIGKAFRGVFNDTEAPALGGHVVRAAIERAQLDAADIDDVLMGCAAQQGTQGYNIGRLSAAAAGLPASVPGMAMDRMCSSGLMTIATAAQNILCGDARIVVAGGVESITLTQNKHKNAYRARSDAVLAHQPAAYMAMIETAEIVSRRYGISREAQDEYALTSQQRTAAAQAAGRFDEEIVPFDAQRALFDKEGKPAGSESVRATRDECNRADTSAASLAALKPVWSGGEAVAQGEFITAGNASQLSDGAAAVVVMSAAEAKQRGFEAARHLSRHGGGRLRSGRNGHRPGARGAETAGASSADGERHRPMGDERGVRVPGHLLPRSAAYSGRSAEREWRRDLGRPSVRHVGHPHDDARFARSAAARRALCRRDDVHRRRHGCRGTLRNSGIDRGSELCMGPE